MAEGKIYDISKDEYVDVATLEKEPEKEEKVKKPSDDAEDDDEDEVKVEHKKADDPEVEKADDPEVEKADDPEVEKADDPVVENIDTLIEKEFKELGIKTKQDIEDIIDEASGLLNERNALLEEVKTLKEKPEGPVFKSKSQEKIFDMLKDYDPDKIPDGLNMLASLVSIDLNTSDTKLILEQEYIMQHPELSIDRARRKFQSKFDDRYTIKDEDSLTAAELREKKEDLEDDLKIERAKAVRFIKEKQEEFKLKSEEDKKVEEPKVNKVVDNGIAQASKEYTKHIDGIDSLSWEVSEGSKEKFNYKFSKEELTRIHALVDTFLKEPSNYNDDGKLKGGFDPEEKFQQAATIICGSSMIEEALKFAQKYAQVIKAEQIAQHKPKRVAKSSGDIKNMDMDSQLEALAKKKKAERLAARL